MKIIFSLISIFMMLPPFISGDTSYYRTLFIFLINRVIDMCFKKNKNDITFLIVWSLINQWVGVVACALAFCSLDPDFQMICEKHSALINVCLFVAAVSCVLKEMSLLVVLSVKEKLVKERIRKEVKQLKGERL